jgi:hypothetical protein
VGAGADFGTRREAILGKSRLRPVIDSDWWLIAPKPNLDDTLPLLSHDYAELEEDAKNQPNDHHIFQATDGSWQLWACVRRSPVGRLLVNWQGDSLEQGPWQLTGRMIRADRTAGESVVDWHGEEFLQSPYIVKHNGLYHMFYGGYDTGTDSDGNPTTGYDRAQKQTSLQTSPDGIEWTRHADSNGMSRVFVGPGAVRDQCVVKFGDTWHIYYAGHHDGDRATAATYVRTSKDLIGWSDWRIAEMNTADNGGFIPESPVVVERGGSYYLFRTHGPRHGTYVFRSSDPCSFGEGDATEESPNFVCHLPTIAPEIIVDSDGREYLTRIDDLEHGYRIRMAKLSWVEE